MYTDKGICTQAHNRGGGGGGDLAVQSDRPGTKDLALYSALVIVKLCMIVALTELFLVTCHVSVI